MADTPTKVADILVPTIFNPYVRQQSLYSNAFYTSGIIAAVGELNFGSQGGTQIQMPFWKALDGRAQLLDDRYNLEIRKVETAQDTAVQHARALVYGATDLAAALAGDDPMGIIGDQLAGNWSREFNLMLISTLRGAMANATDNTLDISALSGDAGNIDAVSFIDAAQKLGEFKDQIAGIAMHSMVEAALAKNDLIETVRDSEGSLVMRTFMGKRVIIDDALTALSGDIYETYLFGPGAIGWGEGAPKVPTETERNALVNGGQEYLVSRRHFVLHPRGIRWTPASGVPGKQTPSDAELAASTNWTVVYRAQDIRIVRFVHRI